MSSSAVRAVLVHPGDPLSARTGGIQSFIRGFVKFAPPEFRVEYLGVTTDRRARPVNRWTDIEIEGRWVRFRPLLEIGDPHTRGLVPLSLRFTARLARVDRRLLAGGVLQFHRPGVALPLRSLHTPKVQVVHLSANSYLLARESELRWKHVPRVFDLVERLVLPQMDGTFVVTRDGFEAYRARFPATRDRFRFLPNWVDETVFKPSTDVEAERASVAGELGLQAGDDLALFVGRLEGIKDPGLLLRAVAWARAFRPSLRLAVAGEGSRRADMVALADELGIGGSVRFLGSRPVGDVARLMRAADILVLSSASEGMPIVVLEALASGLPVVSTDVGEVAGIVTHAETGWIAGERTPSALGEGMLWATAHRRRLASACIAAAAPYRASAVLPPFYDFHRRLSGAALTGEPRYAKPGPD